MKPGTYTQLYIQLIFAVKNRKAKLNKNNRKEIFKYMGGILTNLNHKSMIINGTNNHVHILFGLNPNISISKTVHDIKRNSTLFINKNNLCIGKFQWQEGYGAFTYSRSQIDKVYNYIRKQEEHHQNKTFREEYLQFLDKFEVEYENRFLFNFFE